MAHFSEGKKSPLTFWNFWEWAVPSSCRRVECSFSCCDYFEALCGWTSLRHCSMPLLSMSIKRRCCVWPIKQWLFQGVSSSQAVCHSLYSKRLCLLFRGEFGALLCPSTVLIFHMSGKENTLKLCKQYYQEHLKMFLNSKAHLTAFWQIGIQFEKKIMPRWHYRVQTNCVGSLLPDTIDTLRTYFFTELCFLIF